MQDVLGVFTTGAYHDHIGRVDFWDRSTNQLKLAVTMRLSNIYRGYATQVPIVVQNPIGSTFGWFAGLLGYNAVDSEYRRVAAV